MKAQRSLLGVKKRRRRGGGKIFLSGNLMSCPELYLKVKSDKRNYFLREDFLDLDFFSELFRSFLDFSFRREISRAVQNSVLK